MSKQIQLIAGDWSDDGHGRTSTYIIECNKSPESVSKAYEKGLKIAGFQGRDFCSDYEDSTVPMLLVQFLEGRGVKLDNYEEADAENGWVSVYDEEYVEIYIALAKVGDPTLKITQVNPPTINIGGYGLFH